MHDELFLTAATGGTVLTANKRLARQLLTKYDQRQMAAGLTFWPSPAILGLDAWAMRQLQLLDKASNLLAEAQSQRLWEEILTAEALASGRDLLQVPQAARRAREAHRLLAAYLADFSPAEADEDHLAFLRWREIWQTRLRAGHWLDRADVLATVTAAIAGGQCQVPPALILAGFDDLPPAVQQLCSALEERGCRVDSWQAPAMPAKVSVYGAVDRRDEVRTCARWARLRLEREPTARIGVVAANLGEYQELIERLFRAELDPAASLSGEDGPETFTLSLGTPLSREGMVGAALRLLAAGDPLRLDEIGWLLRSPYLGGAQAEWLERARADQALRKRGRGMWRLAALVRTLAEVPRMAALFEKLQAASRDNRRRLPGEWAERFAHLLDGCGWPGHRGLSGREFQALEHFKGTLGELASLDRVAQPMTRGTALAILNRLAADTVFQPEGGESRIQVLGMLEAAGFEFDALWVLGLHEGEFPAPPRPNPFLPLALQSRLRMPHADASREREFSQRLSRRLFSAAPVVVASWPGHCDGAPQRPSPLLQGLPAAEIELAPDCDPTQVFFEAPCVFESLADDRAAPLSADRPYSGGTTILKDQALCPFRAFAHHRLHAERLESPDLGLDNMARGQLVHGVLERFWGRVVTLDALLQLDARRQAELLAAAAEETVQQHERRGRCDLPPRLRALECRRLAAIASGWLELERRRPPFRVAVIEQRHETSVGRLQVRTRVDRIDELPNGQLAVIDYKTGRPDPGQWLDPRVTEPQLPLYCLDMDDARIGAVVFAMVRNREKECAFKGVARDPEAWPKMPAKSQEKLLADRGWISFDEILAHWRTALPLLGDAFVDGCAKVDPVDLDKTCKYCDLATLCRVGTSLDNGDIGEVGGAGDE